VLAESFQISRSGGAAHRHVRDGLFRLHWGTIGGEVWIDSPGDWAAVVDGSTGYTMVERIRYDPTATYPDQATIWFFTTGQRSFSLETQKTTLRRLQCS